MFVLLCTRAMGKEDLEITQKNGCGSTWYCRSFFVLRGTAMAYAGRNNIYEATIKRMVNQALEAQELEFRQTHASDTDEQLLTYLRRSATDLGHSPWPREITGGSYIEQRFGTWKNALFKARLPQPSTANNLSGFARIKEERTRQEIAYRQKKAEKKLRTQQRQAQQAKKKQPV